MLRVVQQSVELAAAQSEVYRMYLDSDAHAAFTGGGPAIISAVEGTGWSAFDGRIRGRILSLVPPRQIVQSWRSFEWEESELDATLVLTLTASGRATRVDLVQVGVPDRLYDALVNGWPVRYWQPWQAYLKHR